jgi:hypothetical protein
MQVKYEMGSSYNVCCSLDTVRVTESRQVRMAGFVAWGNIKAGEGRLRFRIVDCMQLAQGTAFVIEFSSFIRAGNFILTEQLCTPQRRPWSGSELVNKV